MGAATTHATIVLTFFFVLSLAGAYVVLVILKGTAVVHHRGVQLGGAAAMFVVMFVLLNRYLPEVREGLMEEAAAAQPVKTLADGRERAIAKITLRPSTQVIPSTDFVRLDRNSYTINEDLGVALPKLPAARWEHIEADALPIITITDVPFVGMGIETQKAAFSIPESFSVVGIQARQTSTITLHKDSTINGAEVAYNPFTDPVFFRDVLRAQVNASSKLSPMPPPDIDSMPDTRFTRIQEQMSAGFQRYIENSLPLTKQVRSGVFVITLPEAVLNQGAMKDFLPSMTLLDSAMLHMALSGIFGTGMNTNLFVDQRRKIISFNSSVELANVDIDGHNGRMILNNIGFITVGADRAYFVLLVYPSTDVVEIYKELENALDKIRLCT